MIEWAGVQPWSNGKVGMLGVSYLAIKQWQVAALQPPHLAAMIPWEGMFDHYRDFFRHGGIFSSFFMKLLWDLQIAVNQNGNGDTPVSRPLHRRALDRRGASTRSVLPGNLSNLFETGLQHRFDDAYFTDADAAAGADHGAVPLRRQLGRARPASARQRDRLRAGGLEQKWLEMHTDTHFASMYLAEAVALQMRFFDHFLKGEEQWLREGAAGPADDPRSARLFPPQGTRVAARAHRMGALRARCVDYGAAARRARLRPRNAAMTRLGDGVTFRSAPFAEDTEFTGPLAAKLFVVVVDEPTWTCS